MRMLFRGVVAAAFVVVLAVLWRVTGSRVAVTPSPVRATAAKAYVPSQDELAGRAPEYEILAACGKPAREWTTRKYSGTKVEADVRHFWYPKAPAEVITVAYPGMDDEQMHYWTIYGVAPSLQGDDMYTPEQVRKRMPCMKRWADAMEQAQQQISRQ